MRPSHRHALTALVALSCACHRPAARVLAALDPSEETKAVPEDSGPWVPPLPPPCTAGPVRWLVPVRDAGSLGESPLEGAAFVHNTAGDWLAWIDRTTSAVSVAPPHGAMLGVPLGAGETEAPVLAASGDGVLIATEVQRAGARIHRVFIARANGVHEAFAQPEQVDDSLSIAVVSTATGVILAWDEDRATRTGAIVSQFISHAALASSAAVALPPMRVLTPDELDSGNPTLIAMPDGSAVLAWLAAQDLDADQGNQTAADVYVRALAADGTPHGTPIKITPGPGIRFGVVGLAQANRLWIAYRVAGDADEQSQGDGGSVAVLRLGSDLRPSALPAYATSEHAVPTGIPALLPDGAGIAVFWTEHDGDGTRTMRRAIEPDGRMVRDAVAEPVFAGDEPVAGDASAPLILRHGPRGEPGLASARCPAIPARVGRDGTPR